MPKEKKKLRHNLLQSYSRRSKVNPEALSLKELISIGKAHHIRKMSTYSKSELVDKILEVLSDSSSSSVSHSTITKLKTEIEQLTRKSKKQKKQKTKILDQDGMEETKEPSPSETSRDRKSRAAKKIQKLIKRRTQKRDAAVTKLQTLTRKRQTIKRSKNIKDYQVALLDLAGTQVGAYKNKNKPTLEILKRVFSIQLDEVLCLTTEGLELTDEYLRDHLVRGQTFVLMKLVGDNPSEKMIKLCADIRDYFIVPSSGGNVTIDRTNDDSYEGDEFYEK